MAIDARFHGGGKFPGHHFARHHCTVAFAAVDGGLAVPRVAENDEIGHLVDTARRKRLGIGAKRGQPADLWAFRLHRAVARHAFCGRRKSGTHTGLDVSIEIPFNIPPDRPTRIQIAQGGEPPVVPAIETLTFPPADPYSAEAAAFAAASVEK